jgi:sarcosine oxidase subunit delta
MLPIDCPHCGPRAEIEFRHAGEAHLVRPGPDVSDADWTRYLYERHNPRGATAERWRHVHGCGQYFNAVRDTYTDRIERTYPAGEPR